MHILAHSIAGEEGRDCSGKVRGAELHLGPCGPPKGFAGVGQEPLDRPLKEAASNQKFLVLAPAAGERIFFRVCCSANIARRFDVPLIRIDSPSSLVRKLFARCAGRKNSDLQLFSLHSVALESRCFIFCLRRYCSSEGSAVYCLSAFLELALPGRNAALASGARHHGL